MIVISCDTMSLTIEHLEGAREALNGLFGTWKPNSNPLFLLVCDEFAWSLFAKSQSVGQHLKSLRSRQIVFDFMKSQPGGGKKGCLKISPGVNLFFSSLTF